MYFNTFPVPKLLPLKYGMSNRYKKYYKYLWNGIEHIQNTIEHIQNTIEHF